MTAKHADVIVVGLGAMGSAALYQLAKRGVKALGIDRFDPPHTMGSSHGETRITRQAIGEGSHYVPLVLQSHQIWRDLEAETGYDLLNQVGGLILSRADKSTAHHSKPDFLGQTIRAAKQHDIPHEVLNASEVSDRYPQLGLVGDEEAYFEPGAGFVYPERCIQAQLERARALGATTACNKTILSVEDQTGGVKLKTDNDEYSAGEVVLTTGAWLPQFLEQQVARQLGVYRQVLHWFEPEHPATYALGQIPVYIWLHGNGDSDYFYGFPAIDGQGVKVATEQYIRTSNPDTVSREVDPAESTAFYDQHVCGRLQGLSPVASRTSACLYTVTPDSDFVIDKHPERTRLTVVSACSGHGFKHSAAAGEAAARLALGETPAVDLSGFGIARLLEG